MGLKSTWNLQEIMGCFLFFPFSVLIFISNFLYKCTNSQSPELNSHSVPQGYWTARNTVFVIQHLIWWFITKWMFFFHKSCSGSVLIHNIHSLESTFGIEIQMWRKFSARRWVVTWTCLQIYSDSDRSHIKSEIENCSIWLLILVIFSSTQIKKI